MAEANDLLIAAKKVLRKNDQKFYTSPAGALYPHQWLWDSCFVAIGLRHLDVNRAQRELQSLLRGQWINGMLPNMIFRDSGLYAQDANIWRSQISVLAPDEVKTSGITQPPMLAEAVVRVGEKLRKAERRTWYATMYPALVDYHMWLYRERDPHQTGLVVQIHPYETGLDNTPPWIDQLHKHYRPAWARIVKALRLDQLINVVRRDTRHVTPGQRMDNMDALLFYDLILKLRSKSYESEKFFKKNTLLIADISFNSIFVRANQHLEDIASLLHKTLPSELSERIALSKKTFEQLWDSYSSSYCSLNAATKKLIRSPSIGALMPLYAGCITAERAQQLVQQLQRDDMFKTAFPVPSVPRNAPTFEALRYWQGPTWINTNWLIADGLQRYGYTTEAKAIRESSLDLVGRSGFYEYFSPLDGSPAGAEDFSWTAALVIDWLAQK